MFLDSRYIAEYTESKNNNELLINDDKSSNILKMDKDTCDKCPTENITKTYKKSNRNKVRKTNIEAKKIAAKLKIDDRVQQFHEAEPFITVKDRIDNTAQKIKFFIKDFFNKCDQIAV